jgi:hypothetical protein
MPRAKKVWADPNREGKNPKRQGQRYCSRCGNTVQQARILKSMNLCEFCVKELEARRDGVRSCRGCGQLTASDELRENHGYCKQCVCPACGRPDPQHVRKTGLCYQCSRTIGDFCRVCGKEAAAQVRKNHGLCDDCAQKKNTTGPGRFERQPARKVANGKKVGDSSQVKPKRRPFRNTGNDNPLLTSGGSKPRHHSLGKVYERKELTGGNSRRQSLGKVGQDQAAPINRKSKSRRRPLERSVGLQRGK